VHVRRSKNETSHRVIPLNISAIEAAARMFERADLLGHTEPEHYLWPACNDAGNLWSDLDPVQKLELLRSMEHQFTTLAGFGLIVAAGSEPLRLRSEHIEKPFTIDVLHVVISKASEPKLFAMRDRTAPVQFQ
jgi:hypothetical protein